VQLIAEKLVIERGGRVIVRDASFVAGAGEAIVLTGPNGAGKTTLLRALAGFLPLQAGQIRVIGADDDRPRAELTHAVGHGNAVKAHLSVSENIDFWSRYLGGVAGSAARTDAALAAFDLSDLADMPAAYLSAGQTRRVGLARLLAAPRPIWLLDEPTVSLDAVSVARLADVVNRHTSAGGIVIAATHLPLGLARARDLKLNREAAE
jgi:heme exporter protein A